MDPVRRNILATGAAATAMAAAPQVFAQQVDQGGAFKFYEKGNVRIRYQEAGSGFPLLVTPGGGLNSKISNWQTAVINAMAEFKSDFRCITMDSAMPQAANPRDRSPSMTRGALSPTTNWG
jgi:hypothetical protein